MRKLINLAAWFLTGTAASSLLSWYVLCQQWPVWLVAIAVLGAVVWALWQLDDAIADWLDWELTHYYGVFFVGLACFFVGCGAVVCLFALGSNV